MTNNDLDRAALIFFAVREAGPRASLEQMKAICYCIRNRVRAGWSDQDWMGVIEDAPQYAAHLTGERVPIDKNSRAVQRLMREIDSIFYGDRGDFAEETIGGLDMEESLKECKFWCYAKRPMLPWFEENIARDPKNHVMRTQMGLMMFFE